MSTPAPQPAQPAPGPSVPYGPGPEEHPSKLGSSSGGVTARSAGRTAVKWGIRLLLPFVLRAVFRGLSGR